MQDVIVKKEKINNILEFELGHIRKGDIGSLQSYFRFYYFDLRKEDLLNKNPLGKNIIIKRAISQLNKRKPFFIPDYDKSFFK